VTLVLDRTYVAEPAAGQYSPLRSLDLLATTAAEIRLKEHFQTVYRFGSAIRNSFVINAKEHRVNTTL
jgi:hypothetical protein